MRTHYTQFDLHTIHPFWQFLLGLAGLGLFVVLVTVGFFFFAIFAGVALLAGTVMAIRAWWTGRRLDRGKGGQPDVLDGEFIVVERRRVDRRSDSWD